MPQATIARAVGAFPPKRSALLFRRLPNTFAKGSEGNKKNASWVLVPGGESDWGSVTSGVQFYRTTPIRRGAFPATAFSHENGRIMEGGRSGPPEKENRGWGAQLQFSGAEIKWRRGWDLNPRYPKGTHALQACTFDHSVTSPHFKDTPFPGASLILV